MSYDPCSKSFASQQPRYSFYLTFTAGWGDILASYWHPNVQTLQRRIHVMNRAPIVPLLLGLTMVFLTHRAVAASCSSIEDFGSTSCSGANGCTGERPDEVCFFGCTCAECSPRGSSGECCGRIYYVPNLYPQSGCGNCGECGGTPRTHIRSHVNRAGSGQQYSVELRQDYSHGLVVLSPTVSYREPLFVYLLNHCDHTYRLLAEEAPTRKTGGM
jgi:hypothetical protein